MAPVSCLEEEKNKCPRHEMCATIELWEGLDKVIIDYLGNKNLKELLDKEKANRKSQIDYYI